MKKNTLSLSSLSIKILFGLLIIIGCNQSDSNYIINTAIIHFSGIFITENIPSIPVLRIEGAPVIKKEIDGIYYVSGLIEGFSPLNYPVSIKHFNETLLYSDSNPNDRKSWDCLELYIGNKKMK